MDRDETLAAPLRELPSDDQTLAATLTGAARASAPPPAAERVARYLVLSKLGAGAMGVVYAAYDPKLDRKVALKLLAAHEDAAAARERLQREAQALARLAHPNVVGVYDVDVHEGQLYVAMELVAGPTLGAWLRARPRPWQEVLATFIAAGRGLAAAHAAGLIHRDFKPENVMLGEDGRVRVMDFGLARPTQLEPEREALRARLDPPGGPEDSLGSSSMASAMTRTGALMGTPAYMALEQFHGRADARSDQFGFCVALYEGLYGERPFAAPSIGALLAALEAGEVRAAPRDSRVPAWLRALIVRGLAPQPEQRWPSMDALLDALADDPATRRRRLGAGLLIAGLGAGLLGAALWSSQASARACAGFEAQLSGVWDAETAEQVRARMEATGLSYAAVSASTVRAELDDYARRWVEMRREACAASQRGEQSGALLDLRMACLDDRRAHVAATVELLRRADESRVREAVELVSSLPSLARCEDLDILSAERPPPEDPAVAARVDALGPSLIELAALTRAGEYEAGLEQAQRLAAEAEALGHEPLQARAWLSLGELQSRTGAYEQAIVTLERAYDAALAQRMKAEASAAVHALIAVRGPQLARYEEARRWTVHAQALARARGGLQAEADYLQSVGELALSEGEASEARAAFGAALGIREQELGLEDLRLAPLLSHLGNLAIYASRFDEARAYHERALRLRRAALGPDHPEVAHSLLNLGIVDDEQGQPERARQRYLDALAIYARVLAPEHPDRVAPLANLGVLEQAQGEHEAARAYYEQARAIVEASYGVVHPKYALLTLNLGELAEAQGELEQAEARYARALSVAEQARGPEHEEVAHVLVRMGALASTRGELDAARAKLERAQTILERSYEGRHPKLAELRRELARLQALEG